MIIPTLCLKILVGTLLSMSLSQYWVDLCILLVILGFRVVRVAI